jgi:hypothetical protein
MSYFRRDTGIVLNLKTPDPYSNLDPIWTQEFYADPDPKQCVKKAVGPTVR